MTKLCDGDVAYSSVVWTSMTKLCDGDVAYNSGTQTHSEKVVC